MPESAYALILPGIRDPNIGPVKFAAPLQADHATDDWDPKHVYNRKTAKYSDIREQKRRFQEILLGDITFLDSNGHNIKTLVDGDAKRANPKFLALRESRKSKKEAFVATLDVGKLVSFATPINHPSTGGNKFDFRGFLQYV